VVGTGSVIFGGIDVRKYTGNLVKVPIIPAAESPDGLTRFWVYVNEIKVNQPGGNVVEVYTTPPGSKGQPVLLDSGYTLSALPKAIMDKLVAAFPSAEYVPESDVYVVDCLDPGQGGSLDFVFAGTTINVRYYDFIWHLHDSPYCVLGAFEDNGTSDCHTPPAPLFPQPRKRKESGKKAFPPDTTLTGPQNSPFLAIHFSGQLMCK
jgi:hypothetical protein